ncbi:uncharacterized protein LOC134775790 [Penaeus indicus]|uniref:uncharacterized protein LOC134775790 n=1 Tax=Penaeus indicus TaxID=29960 RepID=UPI00300D58D9
MIVAWLTKLSQNMILGENARGMEEKYLGSKTATITEKEGRRTTGAIFALRMAKEKLREGGQKGLHRVFIDLVKNDDRVPRDELMYFMRKSGVAEKLLNAVKNVYEESIISLRFVTGTTKDFRARVGMPQGSALSSVLTDVIRKV